MPINASVEIGDLVFFSGTLTTIGSGNSSIDTTDTSGVSTTNLLGEITNIEFNPTVADEVLTNSFQITVQGDNMSPPAQGSYIFFAKNNKINTSSIKGYYNSVTFKNNSTIKAELFSTACEIVESSK
tara:strand:+ start:57 stop:437 length:381 start_codon:yes stop_codon:yes gene_type:complete